jgi:hypothetical protein
VGTKKIENTTCCKKKYVAQSINLLDLKRCSSSQNEHPVFDW